MISRRNFCKTCGLLTLSGAMAPSFLAQTATALTGNLTGGKRALVVIQMTGGNDGLNTVVPFGDSTYYNVRPTIGLKDDQIIKLDDQLALNASLKEVHDLYSNGQVAIMRGVGYPNPNYSHFRSMEIWQSANPDGPAKDGWLGRYLDAASQTVDKATLGRLGITIGNTGQGGGAPLAFWTEKTMVLSYAGQDSFTFKGDQVVKSDRDAQLAVARKIYAATSQNELAQYIGQTALEALDASDSLAKIATSYKPAVTYPNTPFAGRLKNVAQLLNSDFGSRVFYVSTDGSFDTHFNEATTHPRLLQMMSEGIGAFYKDLAAHNMDDQVMTMTFSEFWPTSQRKRQQRN